MTRKRQFTIKENKITINEREPQLAHQAKTLDLSNQARLMQMLAFTDLSNRYPFKGCVGIRFQCFLMYKS